MAWSKTDTGIKAGNKEHISLPTNFSTTDATKTLEVEQWRAGLRAAQEIINSKVVGTSGTYTVTISGTSTAGHPANDTLTVTVTAV